MRIKLSESEAQALKRIKMSHTNDIKLLCDNLEKVYNKTIETILDAGDLPNENIHVLRGRAKAIKAIRDILK